jgi:hypothetical protein
LGYAAAAAEAAENPERTAQPNFSRLPRLRSWLFIIKMGKGHRLNALTCAPDQSVRIPDDKENLLNLSSSSHKILS